MPEQPGAQLRALIAAIERWADEVTAGMRDIIVPPPPETKPPPAYAARFTVRPERSRRTANNRQQPPPQPQGDQPLMTAPTTAFTMTPRELLRMAREGTAAAAELAGELAADPAVAAQIDREPALTLQYAALSVQMATAGATIALAAHFIESAAAQDV